MLGLTDFLLGSRVTQEFKDLQARKDEMKAQDLGYQNWVKKIWGNYNDRKAEVALNDGLVRVS